MSGRTKVMAAIYCAALMMTALVGIAFAESGATCDATWRKTYLSDGSMVYTISCTANGCPTACAATAGGNMFGPVFVTCRCPGDLFHCNAAIRNVSGGSSQEGCLGGCTQSQTELCPNIEDEPWVFEGWTNDGDPVFRFKCDCAGA